MKNHDIRKCGYCGVSEVDIKLLKSLNASIRRKPVAFYSEDNEVYEVQ